MPGRSYSAGSAYRYGFNGKEDDKDIGEGGQDYGMRIYDARIGKFLSVDPLQKRYPELTPYQFASNTPIQATDLDGLEARFHYTLTFDKTGKATLLQTALDHHEDYKNGFTAEVTFKGRILSSGTYKKLGDLESLLGETKQRLVNAWELTPGYPKGQDKFYVGVTTLEGVLQEDRETMAAISSDKERMDGALIATIGFASALIESAPINYSSTTRILPAASSSKQAVAINGNPNPAAVNNASGQQSIPISVASKNSLTLGMEFVDDGIRFNTSEGKLLLNKALVRQNLTSIPKGFKEKWSEGGYDFEVRIHGPDSKAPAGSNSATSTSYIISRRLQFRNASGQGSGWERFNGADGQWYKEKDLKLPANSTTSNGTHIPVNQ